MKSIPTRTVEFQHMSFHDEKHGDETVQAIALKLAFDAPNTLLDSFAPGLCASLYRAAEPGDAQELFDGEHKPHLRYPKMPTFRWEEEMIGRRVVVGFGISEDSAIRFEEATVDKFSFALKEGGSVTVTFRVKARPSAEQVAKLFELKGHDVDLTVEPGETRQAELDGGPDPDEDGEGGDNEGRAFPDALDGTGDDLPQAKVH